MNGLRDSDLERMVFSAVFKALLVWTVVLVGLQIIGFTVLYHLLTRDPSFNDPFLPGLGR